MGWSINIAKRVDGRGAALTGGRSERRRRFEA